MTVRTFTEPVSLDESLASVKPAPMPGVDGSRSLEAAKDATKSHGTEASHPLASHTNSKSKPGITFAAQDKLPKLPIPDLESSVNKYLQALKPLQNHKEHQESKYAAKEFLKSDGPEIQEKLKKYAAGKANYIEQFCKFARPGGLFAFRRKNMTDCLKGTIRT